jgi:hypothetical protein
MKWDFAFQLKWVDSLRSCSRRDASANWAANVAAGSVARRRAMSFVIVAV